MIEGELQLIIDRQGIRDTLLRHSACSDAGDLRGVEQLWTEDCRSDFGPGSGGEVIGRGEVVGRIARAVPRFNWTYHQLGESLIEIHGDDATSMTPSICWQELTSGERCWVTFRYYDELHREGDRWLLTYRRMIVTGADGSLGAGSMSEYSWPRLERHVPAGE